MSTWVEHTVWEIHMQRNLSETRDKFMKDKVIGLKGNVKVT